jgi:alkylation response protein AidB-like acyl-CoA dehydrogenase
MNFDFTKDQKLLRTSAREFIEKECPKDKVRELKSDNKGYDPKTWKKMVELGFTGLAIPEEYAGMGGTYIELMILMEEIGRNIMPSPYYATVALCAMPIAKFGSDEQKEKYLPGIAENGKIWSMAMAESSTEHMPDNIVLEAVEDGDEYWLTGTKLFVPYADAADYFLVFARTPDGITAFIVDSEDSGIEIEVIPTTAHDRQCEVRFNDVQVMESDILGKLGEGWEIIEYLLIHAAVLKSAEISGAAQAVLDITIKYARERIQFGKPIGSFQAVQHRLADHLAEVDGLRSLVYQAGWKADIDEPSQKLASMAKAKANKVIHRVCHEGIVIHGAIGWTEEMDIGLYHIRNKALCFEMGGTYLHLERVAQELENETPPFLDLWDGE